VTGTNFNPQGSSWPEVRLLSFAGGSPELASALNRLNNQAKTFGLIDKAVTYDERALDKEYWSLFGDLPSKQPKGFGLWSWKPYIVLREARAMREGDILFYADAGTEINSRGVIRFSQYLEHISTHGFLFFSLSQQNRFWSKADPELVNLDNFFRNQVSATVFGFRISPISVALLEDWLELSSRDYGRLLMHDPSEHLEAPGFLEHRHDQSTLSAVVYRHGPAGVIPDETWFRPWSAGRLMPFLAMRNKSGRSYMPIELAPPVIRNLKRAVRMLFDPSHRRLVISTWGRNSGSGERWNRNKRN
jgi:hypothetical protein